MKAPFPWFGGKSRIASEVWKRFGPVRNYVEPFCGSLAVLLSRPAPFEGTEAVNDADAYICNFWRSVQKDPAEVARHADWPVNENDLFARHAWLVERKEWLAQHVEGDPGFYDAQVAGWWCWGICCWIGSGFCSGRGPWGVARAEGPRKRVHLGNAGMGVNRKLVHLGDAGRGVNRQLVHLGDAGRGVNRQRVHLGDAGRGVNRQLVHLGDAGRGEEPSGLFAWMQALADRLRFVRVCSGDWKRLTSPSCTWKFGNLCGMFLDPPYADTANRESDLYMKDSESVAHEVREWAIEHGDDPRMRIALCGYEGEHKMPRNWGCLAWKGGGYGAGKRADGNRSRERIWFSPHCLPARKAARAA